MASVYLLFLVDGPSTENSLEVRSRGTPNSPELALSNRQNVTAIANNSNQWHSAISLWCI